LTLRLISLLENTDPKDCTKFSFILSGVMPFESGKLGRRRTPQKDEIDKISRVIEAKSRELIMQIRAEFSQTGIGDS
jgi:hypothetical protein